MSRYVSTSWADYAIWLPRLSVLGLLGMALWNPAWWQVARPVHVQVLIDGSDSINPDLRLKAWARVSSALTSLPKGSTYSLIRFAANQVAEVIDGSTDELMAVAAYPDHGQLDTSDTNLQAAFSELRPIGSSDETHLVVILTDGIETVGDVSLELSQLENRGINAVLLLRSQADPVYPVRIQSIDVPDRIRSGSRIPLIVSFSGQIDQRAVLEVSSGGRQLATHEVEMTGTGSKAIRLLIDPQQAELTGDSINLQVSLRAVEQVIDSQHVFNKVVNLDRPAHILYLSQDADTAAIFRSLQTSAWTVSHVTPALFGRALSLQAPDLVILDDIAVGDVSENVWIDLKEIVRNKGAGLLVLGGNRSFGAGGYRHSTLESLLPVTAESSQPLTPAAVLFVVDKSGSMDGTVEGTSRFEYARRAVIDSAAMLDAQDRIGIIAFDGVPSTWLELATYPDASAAIRQAWQGRPSGGTRISQAVEAALAQLNEQDVAQKIMVLVTDGFSDDLLNSQTSSPTDAVEVVIIAVGDAPNLGALTRFARGKNDRVLRAANAMLLPRLVNEAVGSRRFAKQNVVVGPIQDAPMPFLATAGPLLWPPLSGYLLVKAKPEATVFLRTDSGDPLFVEQRSGLGRVVAIPAGLGSSAEFWRTASWWPDFVGGLTNWLQPDSGSTDLTLHLQSEGSGRIAVLQELGSDGDWKLTGRVDSSIVDPLGEHTQLAFTRIAPGLLQTSLPVAGKGLHRLSIATVENSIIYEHFHGPITEHTVTSTLPAQWVNHPLIREWPESDLPREFRNLQMTGTRTLFLVVALVFYGFVLVFERTKVNGLQLLQAQVRKFALDFPGRSRNHVPG